MATWTERLKGWLEWMLAPIIAVACPLGILIVTLRAIPEENTINRLYDMLPDFVRENERIKETFDRMKRYAVTEASLMENAKKELHDLADPLIDSLMEPLINIEVLSPDEAYEKSKTLLALTFGKDIAVGAAGVAAEAASLGQLDTLTKFYGYINSKIGFGGPATMMLKAPIEMGLIRPLSYKLHTKYRNVIPDPGTAAVSYMKGDLAEEYFSKVFSWSGYYPWYEEAFRKGMYREPRYFELSAMVSERLAEPEWMLNKLKRAEYSADDQIVFAGGLRAKYLARYWDKVVARYKVMFKEGFMLEEDFRARIKTLGLPDEVMELSVEEARADYNFDRKMELLAAFRDAFKKDIFTEGEFRKACAGIDMVPERIEDRVYRLQMVKTPKVKVKEIVERQGIKISSKPSGAHIYMDGVDLMLLTPEKIDTTPGRHTMDLYYPDYKVWSGEFTAPADRFIEKKVELEKLEEEVPEIE